MSFRLYSGDEYDVVDHDEDVVDNDNEPFGPSVMVMMRMMATTMMRMKMMRTKMMSVMVMNVMGMMRMTATTMMRPKMITKAGAISESVDILTAPSSETRRSNQGTVAAKPTEIHNFHFNSKINDNGMV